MPKHSSVLLFFLLSASLFGGVNTMTKAIVSGGELRLSFAAPINKNEIKHIILTGQSSEIFDFRNVRLAHTRVPLGLGNNVQISQETRNLVRVVVNNKAGFKSKAYQPNQIRNNYHITLSSGNFSRSKNDSSPSSGVVQSYSGSSRHTEAIVIDAGHGGRDGGAVSGGKREKDLALSIAKKTSEQLRKRGFKVYLTRENDRFLKLDERTRIADRKDAKVFISIHANSVPASKQNKTQGIETFFLQNTRDKRSQEIAAKENTAVLKGTDNVSKHVIIDSVLNGPKIVESNKLAIDIHRRMITNARGLYRDVKDGGVRHAPFYVLVGASRPSVLIEVGYISHPTERQRLFNANYQYRLTNGIAEGIENYLKNRRKEIEF